MILSSIVIGTGSVLVILHGLFGEGSNWMSIAKELEHDFETHLLDQRNHGVSFHDTQHNYRVLAEDLNHYIVKKNIKKFSLIGHSMGGKVAMQFAHLYPHNLEKLIIVDILPKNYQDINLNIFKGLETVLLNSQSRKQSVTTLTRYVQDVVIARFLLKSLYFDKNHKARLRFNLDVLKKNIDNILSFPKMNTTFNNTTYFLSGEKSNYIKFTDIQYIVNLFPKYKIIKIPDAGHWIHFDQKEKFIYTINKILK